MMDDYWPSVMGNLQKARRIWPCPSWARGMEEVDERISGRDTWKF